MPSPPSKFAAVFGAPHGFYDEGHTRFSIVHKNEDRTDDPETDYVDRLAAALLPLDWYIDVMEIKRPDDDKPPKKFEEEFKHINEIIRLAEEYRTNLLSFNDPETAEHEEQILEETGAYWIKDAVEELEDVVSAHQRAVDRVLDEEED